MQGAVTGQAGEKGQTGQPGKPVSGCVTTERVNHGWMSNKVTNSEILPLGRKPH